MLIRFRALKFSDFPPIGNLASRDTFFFGLQLRSLTPNKGFIMTKATSVHKPSIPVRTVAHVYSNTAKAGKGQVPKGSFAAGVAKLATQHKPQAPKPGFTTAKPAPVTNLPSRYAPSLKCIQTPQNLEKGKYPEAALRPKSPASLLSISRKHPKAGKHNTRGFCLGPISIKALQWPKNSRFPRSRQPGSWSMRFVSVAAWCQQTTKTRSTTN